MRQGLHRSSYKCAQEFEGSINIMRREIEMVKKKQVDLLELKSTIYVLKIIVKVY